MKEWIRYLMVEIVLMAVLPIALTMLLSGKRERQIHKQQEIERYLPMVMCREIPWDYEDEMIKAQAVLTRSSLYAFDEKKEKETFLERIQAGWNLYRMEYNKNDFRKAYKRMKEAAEETKGQVLSEGGKIQRGIYHRISAGYTREGYILLGEEGEFLKSVYSGKDIEAEQYEKDFWFSKEELITCLKKSFPSLVFQKENFIYQLCVTQRDNQGYVLIFTIGDQKVSGESIRSALSLSSSHFEIFEKDGKICFRCQGLGHGLGLSQYGGNELAKAGNTYQQILFTYFPDVVILCV